MNFDKSKDLLKRAKIVIPSATQTFSKGPNQWVSNVSPNYLCRGDGAWVWDVDGNKYLDHLMALGPIILGYNNIYVDNAIKEQLDAGIVFSQMHPLEVEVAELIIELIPCAEMVRFAKNGSDATTGAIRAARAFTERDHIVSCGYHGWHDWYIGITTRNKGVPDVVKQLTHTFEYNNLSALKSLFEEYPDKIAAVILEPVGIEPPDDGFLEKVKELCELNGALLIFDEIITGFRLSIGGAQDKYGVIPDMACFGKAMANGLPLSAITGRREVMEIFDDIFFSGTFGGETLSLAACKATLEFICKENVIEHIQKYGQGLIDGLNESIKKYELGNDLKVVGFPSRSIMLFNHDDEYQSRLRRSYFMQECVKRGLLYFGAHVPCYSHGEIELEYSLKVFEEVMPLYAKAISNNDFLDRLEGDCVEPIFRKA